MSPRARIEAYLEGMDGLYDVAWEGDETAIISFVSEEARKRGAEQLGGGRRGKGGLLLFRVAQRRRGAGEASPNAAAGDVPAEEMGVEMGGGGTGSEDLVSWVRERVKAAGGAEGGDNKTLNSQLAEGGDTHSIEEALRT